MSCLISRCPNCGYKFQHPEGRATCRENLMGLWITCPKCKEDYAEWFKTQFIGTTVDDCVATIPCRLFYPAEGETEESMIEAGVKKPESAMKGGLTNGN